MQKILLMSEDASLVKELSAVLPKAAGRFLTVTKSLAA